MWGGDDQYSDQTDWSSPHFEKITSYRGQYLREYSQAWSHWDEARAAVPFGQLCVMPAAMDDPGSAPQRAAACLGGWIDAGLLSAATLVRSPDLREKTTA